MVEVCKDFKFCHKSLILVLSDGREYRLRPLFFAYEDRQQITDLFVETYNRLVAAVSFIVNSDAPASLLWEKTDAIMTDAVTKNLKIEDSIKTALGSSHTPAHLLCKSHTVEALDRTNLEVLSQIEKTVRQREMFESINPALKSFFRGKKTVVEAGIEALLALISHDKSGKSSSLSDLFDHICKIVRELSSGSFKRIYQQQRFAKLGKAAASLLDALPMLRRLLDEAENTNLLIESCKLYLQVSYL